MSFTETLFGGLIVIVALYFITRRVGLSNFWSAFLSGVFPFVGYLVFSLSGGFSGDVLAIHLVVYLATAGVLGVFGSMQKQKEKMHWAPKLLIAFFALLVVFNAILLSVAMHGLPKSVFKFFLPNSDNTVVHTAFPGAVPHDRNKLYEPHQKHIEKQRQLGWKVELEGFDTIKKGMPADLLIRVTDKAGQPVVGAQVRLSFWRMANSRDDQRLNLQERAPGEYAVGLLLQNAGKWIADLDIERGEDRFIQQQPVIVGE